MSPPLLEGKSAPRQRRMSGLSPAKGMVEGRSHHGDREERWEDNRSGLCVLGLGAASCEPAILVWCRLPRERAQTLRCWEGPELLVLRLRVWSGGAARDMMNSKDLSP